MRFLTRHFFRKAILASKTRLSFEPLEDRTVPAWTVSLSGGAVSFIGDAINNSLTLSVSVTGALMHDLAGQGGLVDRVRPGPEHARHSVDSGERHYVAHHYGR